MIYCDYAGRRQSLARGIYFLKTPPTSLVNWCASGYLDSDGQDPSSEYIAKKQQGLKPPQETACLFRSEIENKLPNKTKQNKLIVIPLQPWNELRFLDSGSDLLRACIWYRKPGTFLVKKLPPRHIRHEDESSSSPLPLLRSEILQTYMEIEATAWKLKIIDLESGCFLFYRLYREAFKV